MADYTNVEAVKADMPDSPLFTSTSQDYDNVIAGMITNASRLIDREVGGWINYFFPSTVDETRYFDGNGEEEIYVDPMVTLTSLSVAESGGRAATDYTAWTLDTDFYVIPANYSGLGLPIMGFVVDNDSGSKGIFTRSRKALKVTGVFGYASTPPADIQQAAKITAVRWFMRAKQGWQDASANAMIGEMIYAKALDPDVVELLRPYRVGNLVM
jgi:hypothetical protein